MSTTAPKEPRNGKGWKERSIDLAYIGGVLVVLSTIHTLIVLPQTLNETRAIAREELQRRMKLHEDHATERMNALYRRLDDLATKEGLRSVETRLASMEERMRHLERKGK